MIVNCGHDAQPSGISTGYGVTPDGYTLCLACCATDEREYMLRFQPGPCTVYLSADERELIGWPGHKLMTVTYAGKSSAARKMYVRARDIHGTAWYGTGPLDSGTYVTMRRYKVQA